jgi:hypothetical protein
VFTGPECLGIFEERDEADLETMPGSSNCLPYGGGSLSFAVPGIDLN